MIKNFKLKELVDVPYCSKAVSKLECLGYGDTELLMGHEKLSGSTLKLFWSTIDESVYQSIYIEIPGKVTEAAITVDTEKVEKESGKLLRCFLKEFLLKRK